MSAARQSAPIRPSTKSRESSCSVRRRGRSTKPDSRRFACGPAVALMFIDDSHGLHERIANGRPDETETSSFEILAHGVAVCRRLGNAAQIQGPAAQHLAARELPDVVVERAKGGADLEVGPGVGNEGLHLEAISDDAGILHQAPAFGGAVADHFLGVETVERFAVSLALAQYGKPAQARLSAFQTQHLEERTVVMQRHPPLGIVIGEVPGVRRAPRAAQFTVGMTLRSEFSKVGFARHRALWGIQPCRRTAWQSL